MYAGPPAPWNVKICNAFIQIMKSIWTGPLAGARSVSDHLIFLFPYFQHHWVFSRMYAGPPPHGMLKSVMLSYKSWNRSEQAPWQAHGASQITWLLFFHCFRIIKCFSECMQGPPPHGMLKSAMLSYKSWNRSEQATHGASQITRFSFFHIFSIIKCFPDCLQGPPPHGMLKSAMLFYKSTFRFEQAPWQPHGASQIIWFSFFHIFRIINCFPECMQGPPPHGMLKSAMLSYKSWNRSEQAPWQAHGASKIIWFSFFHIFRIIKCFPECMQSPPRPMECWNQQCFHTNHEIDLNRPFGRRT